MLHSTAVYRLATENLPLKVTVSPRSHFQKCCSDFSWLYALLCSSCFSFPSQSFPATGQCWEIPLSAHLQNLSAVLLSFCSPGLVELGNDITVNVFYIYIYLIGSSIIYFFKVRVRKLLQKQNVISISGVIYDWQYNIIIISPTSK